MAQVHRASGTQDTGWRHVSSVATQLAAAGALSVLVTSLSLYYATARHERSGRLRLRQEAALTTTRLFAELVAEQVQAADPIRVSESLGYLRNHAEVLTAAVFPLSANGEIGPALGSMARPQLGLPPLRAPPIDGRELGMARRQADTLEVSRWIEDKSGRRLGVAVICFSLAQEHAALTSLDRTAVATSCGLAAGLALLAFVLTRARISAPLRALRAAFDDLSRAGTDSAPAPPQRRRALPLGARDELGSLARAFVSMSDAIARREAAIAEQNEQMRLVLGNVGQGFLVVDPGGSIGGQHSAVLESWFGPVRTGQALWQYLGPHDAELNEWLELTWSNIGSMPLAVCLEQLPKSVRKGERTYQIHYHPVRGAGDTLEKMVVVIDDMTALRAREDAERGQRDLVATILALLRDRAGFSSLCEEAEALLAEINAGTSSVEQLERLHTLKGNAYLYKLVQLADACEQLEKQCARDGRLLCRADANLLTQAYAQSIGPVSGLVEKRREHAVQLSSHDFAALVHGLESGASNRELLAQLTRATAEPADAVFARFSERLQVLAHRLGKGPVIVTCDGGGVSFPSQSFAPLWAAVVHVLRNIVDHGLETAWEREQRGKPACAQVSMRARAANGCVYISFQDDGRGVDWERVREQAAKRGLPSATRAQLVAALFAHGLSTADAEMKLSGRGVGLAALASEAHVLGGTVSVESEPGRGTKLTIELPATERHDSLVQRLVG